LVDLATEPSGHVAWPAFTPDGKSVIFQSGSSPGFDTDCQNTSDLYIVDVASRTLRRLDALGGYNGAGTASYLPASDPGLNFAPTMLAEAVGGYFWAVFTSHRSYGSLLDSQATVSALGGSGCSVMGTGGMGMGDDDGKLWVAAIDIGATPGNDPSHPAFYLDGQELEADNLRGYWVLPACQANGTSCHSGDECCCGFCRSPSAGGAPICECKPPGCSQEFETCVTASDCCVGADQCINGRCAQPPPQVAK
jgi:WD40-like Beta Propeller Repeat